MHVTHEELSIIDRVSRLLEEALLLCASDIHLEPMADCLRVRFRLDGVLHDRSAIDHYSMLPIISRIKVLSNINIAERRLPQDGKFSLQRNGKLLDCRVSTFPTVHGEKIVIRILDGLTHAVNLDQLGMVPEMYEAYGHLVSASSGFFLVTGPTGSGKTTTLYMTLMALNKSDKNMVTLEDPVEYSLPGITQGYINVAAGFTFEKGIRALLRQDPDIMMIGEMRDRQTARIGIEAALTGHMVFTTLHTNNAPGAVMRLLDMGIEPFLINAAVTGVLAQRLVRRICGNCRYQVPCDGADYERINDLDRSVITQLYRGRGCEQCVAGYKGRIGIFELLTVTDSLRVLIREQPVMERIVTQARADGMKTLMEDGLKKVSLGLTTYDELLRVVR